MDGTLDRFLSSLGRQANSLVVCIARGWQESTRKETADRHEIAVEMIDAVAELSLSESRNLGLQYLAERDPASDGIVAFPDDDCWYVEDTLANVAEAFATHPDLPAVSGRYGPSRELLDRDRFPDAPEELTVRKAIKRVSSVTIFIRLENVMRLGGFNPQFGTGTALLAGEDTDYVLRMLEAGLTITYRPEIIVGHPYKERPSSFKSPYVLILASHIRRMPRLLPLLVRGLLTSVFRHPQGGSRLYAFSFLRPALLSKVAEGRANTPQFAIRARGAQ